MKRWRLWGVSQEGGAFLTGVSAHMRDPTGLPHPLRVSHREAPSGDQDVEFSPGLGPAGS